MKPNPKTRITKNTDTVWRIAEMVKILENHRAENIK